MRRVITRSAMAAIVVALASSIAVAQEPGSPPRVVQRGGVEEPELPPPGPMMTPAQVQELFDAMMVMQAQAALSLSEQQYAQFLTRLRVLQTTRRRNQQQRMRVINELQKLTNPRNAREAVSEADIRDRLRTLQDIEMRATTELRRAYDSIDEILDVRQQARFRVFEEQIERKKLELIARARQNNRPNNPNRQTPPRRPPGR
jgi:hypothetical protein